MKERTKLEAMGDIAMSVIPIAGSVYHGRKNHKEGFIEASKMYERKLQELKDQKRQIRMDVFGESQVFICPESWDPKFWRQQLESFINFQYEQRPSVKDLLSAFLEFCINNFPKRRLAETLEDMKVVLRVIQADSQELAALSSKSPEDVQLAIDFLKFYKEDGEIKELKEKLVATLPNTNGCNFLVLGKTGVGKSSLLNSLLGDRKFETGTGKPVTTKGIHSSEGTLDGIKVRVYDSWGLEAGAVEEWHRMLADAQKKHDLKHSIEDWFHAVVYCISAGSARVEDVDIAIIRSLLQDDLYVVVALTKADQCSAEDAESLRKTLCSNKQCEKLLPENVIETCVGAETRSGKTDPFGIPELKRAILSNYKKIIVAQFPYHCTHLAKEKIVEFKEKTKEWIETCEWKYDENENNRPLKSRCEEFANNFLHTDFPELIRMELIACSRYGRNLAAALQFDDIEDLVPQVPDDMKWYESVGHWFAKTLDVLKWWGPTDNDQERDRLTSKLEGFCKRMVEQIDKQQDAIAKKVREVMK